MHRARSVLLLTLAAALLPAAAALTLRPSFPIDETFRADGLTALRGVPVWIQLRGRGSGHLLL